MLKRFFPIVAFVILGFAMTGCGSDNSTSKGGNEAVVTSDEREEKNAGSKKDTNVITVTIGEQKFEAVLEDNETAKEFSNKLPVTFDMSELNGNEKYFNMDESIHSEPEQVGQIEEGDLMLYGSDCVVLFYDSFSTEYSYTRIGKVSDSSGLREAVGKGEVTVSFEQNK